MDSPHAVHLRLGRFSEAGRIYALTTVVKHRLPLFVDLQLARLVIAQLRLAQAEHLAQSLAWVVMPDHVHWLVQLQDATLSTLMGRMKSRSTRAINSALGRDGALWQRGYYDRAVRREEELQGIARYIVMNPVRAGLARTVKEYSHWDAVWV
ncbi:REP-associated tyrosine transposase [Pseudomonas urmiensis]|uniref:REP-associated tyrosine transposase n=1 Tax=Pseudomonas urmiensis TaxID=2745493 RepID=UPI003CA559D0